ncbi:putative lipid-binding protein AIR1B [Wolffia australiana]
MVARALRKGYPMALGRYVVAGVVLLNLLFVSAASEEPEFPPRRFPPVKPPVPRRRVWPPPPSPPPPPNPCPVNLDACAQVLIAADTQTGVPPVEACCVSLGELPTGAAPGCICDVAKSKSISNLLFASAVLIVCGIEPPADFVCA